MSRPIHARLDWAALRHNHALVRRQVGSAQVWSVIKANAYGHGMLPAALALQGTTDGFALIELDGAIALRKAGIRQPILLLEGFYQADELPLFADGDRWSVRLNEIYYLPVWLLDLCVLNADGRCYLVEGEEPSPLVIEPWRSRLAALLDRSRSVATAVKLRRLLNQESKALD